MPDPQPAALGRLTARSIQRRFPASRPIPASPLPLPRGREALFFWARMLRGRDTENSSAADGATLRQCRSRLVTAPAARWVLKLPRRRRHRATTASPGLPLLALRWPRGTDTPNPCRHHPTQSLCHPLFPWRRILRGKQRPADGAGFVPNPPGSGTWGWGEHKGLIRAAGTIADCPAPGCDR